jgi:uncharacterized membrane protein (UPF0127 family)
VKSIILVWALLQPITGLARDPGSISSALPAGARLGSQKAISSTADQYVVTYQRGSWNVGVVVRRSGKYVLLWHERVAGTPLHLDSPEAGVFRLATRRPGSASETIYAYELRSGAPRSAIDGTSSGRIVSQEMASLRANGFTVRRRDLSHVGNVKYRIVETYAWSGDGYALQQTFRQPDYPDSAYPVPAAWMKTEQGSTILIRLEVADTEAARELGLMYRNSLDSDSGMIFVWSSPVLESFWMQNTLIPLSIAWLGSDGTVQEIQDMQPETTTFHTPGQPYLYAIEANLGFFRSNGIAVGDRFQIKLRAQPSTSLQLRLLGLGRTSTN